MMDAHAGKAVHRTYRPQLATPSEAPPSARGYVHEIAYDGMRMGCRLTSGKAMLVDGQGGDVTRNYPEIAAAARALTARSALLDGEVCVVLPDGRTSQKALRDWLSGRRRGELVYFVFDLLERGGADLGRRPLSERRRALLGLVPGTGPVRPSHAFEGPASKVFREACRLGFLGIVSKRLDAIHEPGDSASWIKTRCPPRGTATASDGRVTVCGVSLSHPERVVFPAEGITKLDLARYHAAVAPFELPHLRGRPLTLLRCGGAIGEGCAFMKHSKVWAPAALRRVRIQEKHKLGEYLVADTAEALLSLVQMDAIELHTWNTRDRAVELPDRIVVDLDPGPRVTFPAVVEGALRVREALDTLGLRSWVKTTGGRGLHVVAPIVSERPWSDCLGFSRDLCEALSRGHPRLYTTRSPKAGRERLILLDYLRNNRTNTSIAAYSPRARPGAPVSVTITWDELSERLDPSSFTIRSVPERLASLAADPWKDYFRSRQRLRGSILQAVKG
jgi:bifunctional non-homologous end joining protein LigD